MLHNSLFDPKNKVKIVQESSSWPHTNDCYDVDVECPGRADEPTRVELNHVKKEEVELAAKFREIAKKLTKKEREDFLKALEDYGHMKYCEGSDSAEMSHAEGEL